MLAERFNSRVFEQIATSAASATMASARTEVLEASVHASRKPILQHLMRTSQERREEARPAVRARETGNQHRGSGMDFVGDDTRLGQDSSSTREKWIFVPTCVAKDRKDYFGAVTLLGQIVAIAEKLMGPKIVVLKEEQQLKQIAPQRLLRFSRPCAHRFSARTLQTAGSTVWRFWSAPNRSSSRTSSISLNSCRPTGWLMGLSRLE